jgi:hypothetical protein
MKIRHGPWPGPIYPPAAQRQTRSAFRLTSKTHRSHFSAPSESSAPSALNSRARTHANATDKPLVNQPSIQPRNSENGTVEAVRGIAFGSDSRIFRARVREHRLGT